MAKLMICNVCKGKVASTADVCPHCGATDEVTYKENIFNTKITIKDWKVIVVIILIVIVGVKFLISNMTNYYEENRKQKWEQRQEREKAQNSNGNVHAAWAYTQIYVEKQLKSPSSADFPFGGSRDVKYLGNNLYSFDSYVDAQNSYGANIRTYFKGTIRQVTGGWTIESFSVK